MFFFLAFHINFQVTILTAMFSCHGYAELFEGKSHSFQVLFVLPAIDEVTAYHIGLVWEGVIRTENSAIAFLLAQNLLITFSSTDMLRIGLNKIWKAGNNDCRSICWRIEMDLENLTYLA